MNAVRSALSPFYRVLELAGGFALQQKLGEKTLERYRRHIARNLTATADRHVLDIGCGIGSFRPCFAGAYTGIDINPAYITEARGRYGASFEAMDCTRLGFADRSFDEVVTIATLHHIDDGEVAHMVAEALRVCRPGGYFHIIDAILPIAPNLFKTVLFRLDRGNYPRNLARHLAVIGNAGRILEHQVLTGPLHDTVYVRVARSDA
jgi:ubiquinone/menaquinone biosynthesis C-methylase UbiE